MRFDRRQFIDLMTFGPCPRQMLCELFGLLVGVETEWQSQGASPAEIDLTAFDWDYVPYVECGGNTGPWSDKPPETLYEDDEYAYSARWAGPHAEAVQAYRDRAAAPGLSRPRHGRLAAAEAAYFSSPKSASTGRPSMLQGECKRRVRLCGAASRRLGHGPRTDGRRDCLPGLL